MEVPVIQAAPLIAIFETPDRCATGKSILHARAEAVKAANIETWWAAEGKGWLKYCKHVAKCETCQTYELWRKNEQDTRFSSQESRG